MRDGNATGAGQVLQQASNSLDPARILADPIAGEYRERVRVLAADYHDALTRLTLQAVEGDSAGYYLTKAEFYGVKNDIPAAHAYYDSARVVLAAEMAARPPYKASGQQPVETQRALPYDGLARNADAFRLGPA